MFFFLRGGGATGTKSVLSVFVVFSFGFKSQREKAKKKKKTSPRFMRSFGPLSLLLTLSPPICYQVKKKKKKRLVRRHPTEMLFSLSPNSLRNRNKKISRIKQTKLYFIFLHHFVSQQFRFI